MPYTEYLQCGDGNGTIWETFGTRTVAKSVCVCVTTFSPT